MITLLSMGANGYRKLLTDREDLVDYFGTQLAQVAEKHGERALQVNGIAGGEHPESNPPPPTPQG